MILDFDSIRKSSEYLENRKRLTMPEKTFGCYLAGLFETDGDASLGLRKDQDRPSIRIAQNDVPYLLALQDILEENYRINSRFIDGKNVRAPRIAIESWSSARLFIDLIKRNFNPSGFCCVGPKAKELYAIELLLERSKFTQTPQNKAIVVDLKENWHRLSGRIRSDQQLPRSHYERVKNLANGSSVGAANKLFGEIETKYSAQEKLFENYNNGTITAEEKTQLADVKSRYLSGLLEGDGCFSFGLYQRTDNNKRYLDVNLSVSMTGSPADQPSHKVLTKSLGVNSIEAQTQTSYTTYIKNLPDVEKVLKFVDSNPVCRDKNLKRFEVLKYCFQIKQKRQIMGGTQFGYTKDDLKQIVNAVYSAPTSHGKVRKASREEVMDWVESMFQS